ncbi:hypothetical protein CHUAL_009114 [Chamberlinius hualienensis]
MVGFDPKSTAVDSTKDKPKVIHQLTKKDQSIAGAVSGIFTRSIVQPLDVIKIRFQLQLEPIRRDVNVSKYRGVVHAFKTVASEEGVQALWKGHVPAQCLSITYGISQFVVFEFLTLQAWNYLPKTATTEWRPILHFCCGGLAGCFATCTGHPFDVIRTRLVSQGEPKIYPSMLSAARTMYRLEGAKSLYKGLVPTVLQIMPHSGIQFCVYTSLVSYSKHVTMRSSPFASVGWFESMVFGGVAGIVAKFVVYPLDLIKKRLQVQGFEEARKKFGKIGVYRGLCDCMVKIVRSEGIRGLYKGLLPSVIKASVATGCTFCVYEQVSHAIFLIRNDLA